MHGGDQRTSSDVYSMILHIISLKQGLSLNVELGWLPIRLSCSLFSAVSSRRVTGVCPTMPDF